MSRLARLFALTVIAAIGLLIFAGPTPASAHAKLLSTSPTNGQALDQGPTQVVLTFDEPVTVQTLRATSDDGTEVQLGEPTISGNNVTATWPGGQKGGLYRVGYLVTSTDGHVIDGVLIFTYTTASPGTPPPAPGSSTSIPWLLIGVLGLVAAGLVAGFLTWKRNQSSETSRPAASGGRHAAPAAAPAAATTGTSEAAPVYAPDAGAQSPE